jgi:hypothetical protein
MSTSTTGSAVIATAPPAPETPTSAGSIEVGPTVDGEQLTRLAGHCVGRVVRLLARRHLHLHRDRVGDTVALPDGRRFVVYRSSSSSEPCEGDPITMTMWFRLRWVPPGARVRAFLFERESILNTVLYAGFEGYRTKLWTVDRTTNGYAGFYTWRGRTEAERYARYAMRMLRPLSVPGSLGCQLDEEGAAPAWLVPSPMPRPGT